jgi:hypothetical protein
LTADVQPPLPMKPVQVERESCNYQRLGIGNLLLAFEPAMGKRDVTVTEWLGKVEWATYIKKIADDLYPKAGRITLACDHPNTHSHRCMPPSRQRKCTVWRTSWTSYKRPSMAVGST